MSGGDAYQQLVKEQLGVDLSRPAGPPSGAQPIRSIDPRDSFGDRAFEERPAASAVEARGGGTRLSALLKEDVRQPERTVSLPPCAVEDAEPLGRPVFPEEMWRETEPPPKPLEAEGACRRLGLTVAVISALLFSPVLQDKLADYIPSAFVFRDGWMEVLSRSVILGLAVYIFRRFFASAPCLRRAPYMIERVGWGPELKRAVR
jgi:hypothetical protein